MKAAAGASTGKSTPRRGAARSPVKVGSKTAPVLPAPRRESRSRGSSPLRSVAARLAALREGAVALLPRLLRERPARPVEVSESLRVPRPSGGPDRLLVGAVLLLAALGVVMVFSAGANYAAKRYGDWTYFLKREVVYAAVGLVAFQFGLRTDYARYRRFTYPLLFLSVALLAAVLVVGTRAGGAVRWFRLGPLSFQPAELAKFALALYLAVLLTRKAEKVKDFSVGFLPPLVMTGVIVGLLLLQPDLGTGVVMGVTALGLLFIAGTRTSYIIIALLVAAPVGWKFLIAGTEWRMRRILAFLDPWGYREHAAYQLWESLLTVGSGGLTGQGLGQSKQKLLFLPEAHTDFILAVIGEELGFVGIVSVVALFSLLVWRGFTAAARARDVLGCYLAFGITMLFGLQALTNMAVVLGLMPTKGIPLPFISYGGTSLVVSLFMAGVLCNVSARNPEPRIGALFAGLRGRRPSKNKRSGLGPRIVVLDVGKRRRPPRVPGAAIVTDPNPAEPTSPGAGPDTDAPTPPVADAVSVRVGPAPAGPMEDAATTLADELPEASPDDTRPAA